MIENTKFETSTPKVKPATSNEVNDAKILPLKKKSRKDKKNVTSVILLLNTSLL